jgi:hypothetical protein
LIPPASDTVKGRRNIRRIFNDGDRTVVTRIWLLKSGGAFLIGVRRAGAREGV